MELLVDVTVSAIGVECFVAVLASFSKSPFSAYPAASVLIMCAAFHSVSSQALVASLIAFSPLRRLVSGDVAKSHARLLSTPESVG